MIIKEIDAALDEGQSLKVIAQAYSEIANLKIRRIRANVERNRIFFDEILKVYETVKGLAIKKKAVVVKPKKRLCILLTSNLRFYGSINTALVNYFVGSTRELTDVDKVIVGKDGINYFKATKLLPKYQEILLKEDMPTNKELVNLANLSSQYNQVLVFHSKLKSLLVQIATFTDVTATSLFKRDPYIKYPQSEEAKSGMRFIFEPELPKILSFFDSQILTLLLEQTFLESELSRTASRFIAMDTAESEANKFIKDYQKLKALAKKSADNNTILENFATMMAVRSKMV
ncbi:F0F1 ATP synthase subunit gamma [Patescibacteria group bacterium]|nr:F0F1 ATP synthase subunit gamma [Patescibacteria group bacterium]